METGALERQTSPDLQSICLTEMKEIKISQNQIEDPKVITQ